MHKLPPVPGMKMVVKQLRIEWKSKYMHCIRGPDGEPSERRLLIEMHASEMVSSIGRLHQIEKFYKIRKANIDTPLLSGQLFG